jgi:hypothetical protein
MSRESVFSRVVAASRLIAAGSRAVPRSVVVMIALVLAACGPPSEQSLVEQFPRVRPALDTLCTMAKQDTIAVRIAPDFVDPPSLTPERWNRYRELFARVHSDGGLSRTADGVMITIESSGLAVSGTSIGYAHFPTPPSATQVRPTLAGTPAGSRMYRHLDAGWYLYLDR